MKRVKKYISICALVISPAALLAKPVALQSISQTNEFTGQAFSILPSLATSLPQQQARVATPVPQQGNAVTLNDITPNKTVVIQKEFVKPQSLKTVLNQAQESGKLGYVMSQLEEKQLPKSLALIPVIESRYKNGAQSNKGAGGIWQLMPGTAKQYGIAAKDRYDTKESTEAALKYFKVLYNKFGSWELAIAAYNAGDGKVQRALAKNPNARNVQELNLPKETKEYVQKFYQLESYAAVATPSVVEA